MLWLVACAPRLPSAHVDGLELVGLGWEQADAVLQVVVDNPLPVPVPITGLRWAVEVDGTPVAFGSSQERVLLAADGETRVPVPVTLRYGAVQRAAGAVDARAVVSLDVETPARTVTLELAHDFVLPALSAPTMDLVSLTPSWDGSMGHLTLTVTLGLPAWVGTGSLGWTVSADQRPLAAGSAALGGDHRLTLDVGVDPTAVMASSWDAWRGRVSVVHLALAGRLETGYGVLPVTFARDLVLQAPPP